MESNNQTAGNETTKNFLELGFLALESGNAAEAISYANKVLEIDTQNAGAWNLRMNAADQTGTLDSTRIREIIVAGNNVIKYSGADETKKAVYELYLNKMISVLNLCSSVLSDTNDVEELYEAERCRNPGNATNVLLEYDQIAQLCISAAHEGDTRKCPWLRPNQTIKKPLPYEV